jgi:tetratricopeptide (TPR) repeat protein
MYVLGKTLRRYRWGVAACCAFIAGLATFTWHAAASAQENFRLARREQQAREHAEAATTAAKEARDDEVAQRKLAVSEAEHAQSVTRFLVEMLDLADPDVTQRSDLTVREVLERASAELDGAFDDRPQAEATLRMVVGRAYAGMGEPQPARRHLERALLLRERTLASGPAQLYEVMWPLTHVLADLSDTLAHPRAGRCVRVGRQVLAETLPDMAARCGELAGLMKYDYPAAEADSAREDVLRMAAAALPPDDDRWLLVADQLYFCGMFLAPRQNMGPACEYYQEALDIYRRKLPETNTRIVRTLGQLLTAQVASGRDDEAQAVALEAVALVRETLPADHWYVALCNARLGACLIGLGRHGEAEPLLERGYTRVVAARGAAGRYASEILRSLVRLDDAAGRPEQAARRRDALAAAIAGSPEYASWVASDIWATSARAAFGPPREALADSLERLKASLRTGSPGAADAVADTTQLWDAHLPDDHPLSAVIAEIVITWLAYDAPVNTPTDAVLDMTRRTVRIARQSAAIHPRKRAYILAQAGIQFRERSQLKEAEAVLCEALTILDAGHGTYAFGDWARAHLGVVLAAQERFDEAEPLLRSGYEGLLDYGGPTTADTRGALKRLLSLYEETDETERFAAVATDDIRNLLAASEVDPIEQYGAAWRIARDAGLSTESYELSFQLARRAADALPDSDSSHRALGAALLRIGRSAEALSELQEADRLALGLRRRRLACDLALIAMAHHRLGDDRAAGAALTETRRLLADLPRGSVHDLRLLSEAEAMIGAR